MVVVELHRGRRGILLVLVPRIISGATAGFRASGVPRVQWFEGFRG